ncbi:TPA: hypothetical protein CPT79_07350 [Candidatus Gastranaerophilales bacterium HUM_6]|jgi:Mg/Co/Ni transporter MgtE|nr:hypothetical protein [bacterium]CDE92486.1 mgtE intracellular region [Fusobacterium sp. CAG:815]DAA89667.1 MAG TPA: hypothetical protein CPT79_07350 [Candidatus Gastranaerophilales bacterium HUM_6]DAA92438.1 MAG TPA: hypothetical protein CPT93_06560 [Candidatus Gastranaerophilales bacterium HUM_7]DAB02086.1 MAG TPA: hypothetical protein CPT84_05905 [Candidatus Gastranaerophilales bacterium HUM_12]DAB06068.1 MAG TPA: hypothetical protein CPT78_05830 [Candidatus Gastranaerophilales bacterium 
MSLAISSTLEYLQMRLGISEAKMQIYADKSLEQILDAEAAQGNQAAIQMAADMFSDPNQLVELFQLADPENKLVIMQSMTSAQLEKLVPMLETDDLVEGLQFFTQDSLMDLLKEIPKEELVKTVFQMFSEQQIIENMPDKQLDKLLTSTDMDKEMLLQNLKSIPEMYLQQILESVTGEESKESNANDLVNQIGQLGDMQYKHAIMNLQPTQKQELTLSLTSREPKLYEKFDTDAYTHIIAREREKDEIVKSFGVIKPEYLQKMIDKLPQDILAVVTTQIDTDKFADSLINKFPEVLAKFIAG